MDVDVDKLHGFNAFSLDYVIKWPISLIINKKVLIYITLSLIKKIDFN